MGLSCPLRVAWASALWAAIAMAPLEPVLAQPLQPPRSCVLFSGTFDPPHLGHLDALQSAMASVASRCGIALLNLSSRFKPQMSPLAQREQMAQLLFGVDRRISLADAELTAAFASFEHQRVLAILRQRFPDAQFYILMGDDVFDKGLVTLLSDPDVTYLVALRHGTRQALPAPPVRSAWIRPQGIQGCSSSGIRTAYSAGALLPRCTTPVLDQWIRARGLYGSKAVSPLPRTAP